MTPAKQNDKCCAHRAEGSIAVAVNYQAATPPGSFLLTSPDVVQLVLGWSVVLRNPAATCSGLRSNQVIWIPVFCRQRLTRRP
jgi:hypothetical protein